MADKYAHLRPPKPRSCHRADRVPKRRYPTQERAQATADRYEGYHAYHCSSCDAWHVGRRPHSQVEPGS